MSNSNFWSNSKDILIYTFHIITYSILILWLLEEVWPGKNKIIDSLVSLAQSNIVSFASGILVPITGFFLVKIIQYFHSPLRPTNGLVHAAYKYSFGVLPFIPVFLILMLETHASLNSNENNTRPENKKENEIPPEDSTNDKKKKDSPDKKNTKTSEVSGGGNNSNDASINKKNSLPPESIKQNQDNSTTSRLTPELRNYLYSEYFADINISVNGKKEHCFIYKMGNAPVTESDYRPNDIIVAVHSIILYPVKDGVRKSSTDINENFILINKASNDRITIKRN
jgi:hypothetical protein